MTERDAGYLVILEEDVREDSQTAERVTNAIEQLKSVCVVEPVKSNMDQMLAKKRAKQEIINKLWELLSGY